MCWAKTTGNRGRGEPRGKAKEGRAWVVGDLVRKGPDRCTNPDGDGEKTEGDASCRLWGPIKKYNGQENRGRQ